MSTLTLKGLTSGSSVLKAPDSGSNAVTFTMPASAGTVLSDASTLDATKLSGALPAIDGSNLTGAGPTHTSAGSAPGSPAIGDFWHDTTNEKLYIRTNDGTSDIWMQI